MQVDNETSKLSSAQTCSDRKQPSAPPLSQEIELSNNTQPSPLYLLKNEPGNIYFGKSNSRNPENMHNFGTGIDAVKNVLPSSGGQNYGQPPPPPYPGQPYQQPYPGQPYPGQPYPGQPYPQSPGPGQRFPSPGQQFQQQPYPGQSYPQQPYPGQSYPQQPYPGQYGGGGGNFQGGPPPMMMNRGYQQGGMANSGGMKDIAIASLATALCFSCCCGGDNDINDCDHHCDF